VQSYVSPDLPEVDNEPSGLPWGTLSLKHILSKRRSSLKESERGIRKDEYKSRHDYAEEYSIDDLKHDDFQPSSLYLEGNRFWSASRQSPDYFGPIAGASSFSERHLVVPTSPGTNSRGVPLTPQSPGDIAVPLEIASRGIDYAVSHGKTDNVGQDLVHSDVDELARILQRVELP
jgi:hypothetical protein